MENLTMFGITHCGKKHAENEDYILLRSIDTEKNGMVHLLGVADGISSSIYGGSVARWLMEKQLAQIPLFEDRTQPIAPQLQQTLLDLSAAFQEELADNDDMLSSGAAIALAAVHHGVAECFWAGDVSIFLNHQKKKYAGSQISDPLDVDRFRQITSCFGMARLALHHATVPLAMGDVLTITSDGANADQHVLQHYYQKHGVSKDTLTIIANLALRNPHADDTSLVALTT